jgi:hypothetical protein
MNEQKSQAPIEALPLDWRPPEPRKARFGTRVALGCLVITLVMVLSVGGAVLAFNQVCIGHLSQLMPAYPGAETLWEYHNFLSEYGIGDTVKSLHSDDDPAVVTSWYGVTIGKFRRNSIQNNTFGYWLADESYTIVPDTDVGRGSLITLNGKCAAS